MTNIQQGRASHPAPLVELGRLTRREREVARCVAFGMRDREIARRLGTSEHVISSDIDRLLRKVRVSSRSELVEYALRMGLV